MMEMYIFFGLLIHIVILAIVSARGHRSRPFRWGLLFFCLVLLPSFFLAIHEILGAPKPTNKEFFRNDDNVQVLGHHIDQGKAIYIMMLGIGWSEPRLYVIPWFPGAEEFVNELRRKGQDAVENGNPLYLGSPFKRSLEPDDIKHSLPPRAEPPKELGGRRKAKEIEL